MDDLTRPDEAREIATASRRSREYEAPGFSVISLDCEISAYAPDDAGDDLPLF